MGAVESGVGAVESTTVVIAGGGPAGMMAGLLLARAGIAVTVLEKHAGFLRDFGGDGGTAGRARPGRGVLRTAAKQVDRSVAARHGSAARAYRYLRGVAGAVQ